MVNYRYDLKEIERNHEAYANEGVVAASKAVRNLLRSPIKKAPTAALKPAPQAPALGPPQQRKV
jgi:malonyl-CoA decarboxylase